jgi:carbonic anhydrase
LVKSLSKPTGETKLINVDFNLNDILPEQEDYYTYGGSLTTPPCNEKVIWFVCTNPVMLSLEQQVTFQVQKYYNTKV